MSATRRLSAEERGIVAIVRYNRATPRNDVRRAWEIGRLSVVYHRRSRQNLFGRFGGGWQWKVGIQVGSSTAIVSLIVCELRFCLRPSGGAK